jgi:hypothetical protein
VVHVTVAPANKFAGNPNLRLPGGRAHLLIIHRNGADSKKIGSFWQVETDGVVGVVEGDGAGLPEGNAEGAVGDALFENADVVGESDGEVEKVVVPDGEARDGRARSHDYATRAGAQLSGVAGGQQRLAIGGFEKRAAQQQSRVPGAEIDDEMEGSGSAAWSGHDGCGNQRGSAVDRERDGIGAGWGRVEKGQRVCGVVNAEDVLAKDGKAEQEVDGESGGGAEVAEVDGDGGGEGEMFGAEVEVVEDDGVHGLGLAAAGNHADGLADVEMERLGEGVVDAEAAGSAVEDGVEGLAVEGDGDADEVVLKMEGDRGLLGGNSGDAEQK